MHCRAQQSKHDSLFSNRAQPKQQFTRESMILGGFPPSRMGEGSREKGRSLVIGAVHATKQQGEKGIEVLLHLCMGVNGCAPWNHTDLSSSYSEVPTDGPSLKVCVNLSSLQRSAVMTWKC